jgi:hypothetical protein
MLSRAGTARPCAVVAAILLCLVAGFPLAPRGRDAEDFGASRDPPRVLQEEPLGVESVQKEVVPEWMSITAEVLWAIYNFAVGAVLYSYLTGLVPTWRLPPQPACDMTIAWFHVGIRIIEGAAFVLVAINMVAKSNVLLKIFQVTQVILHAPLLWAVAHYFRKYDRPKTWQSTLKKVFPLMGILGSLILATVLGGFVVASGTMPMPDDLDKETVMKNLDDQAFLFLLLGLGPPLIFQALYMIGLWCASSRPTCCDPRIQTTSFFLVVATLVGLVAHLRRFVMLADPTQETVAGMIIQKIVEVAMIASVTVFTVELVEFGAFNDTRSPAGTPWATERGAPLAEGKKRWVASPERLWSVSFIFYFTAFFLAGYFLFVITGWDPRHDSIVIFYQTMHPCVLLDYLPGTLFAQPFFDCQILCIIVCMVFNFMRHIAVGSLFSILLSAGGMMLATVVGACFNLVFTFNPREVSVLLHSVPYMLYVCVQFIFIGCEAACIFFDVGHNKHPWFTVYVTLTLGMCFFINVFMADFLLKDDKSGKPLSQWPVEEQTGEDITTWQLMTAFVSVLVLDLFFMAWYKINPNSSNGIAFDLGVTNREQDEDAEEMVSEIEQAESEPVMGGRLAGHPTGTSQYGPSRVSAKGPVPKQQADMFYDKPIVLPLIVAAAWAAIGIVACFFVNDRVYGCNSDDDHVDDRCNYRKSIRSYPGSSVLVVCWVFAVAGITAFAASSAYYEHITNTSPVMRMLTYISGFILVVSSLVAHGGTIPNSDEWMVYDGPQCVFCGLLLWTLKDVALLLQDWPQLRPTNAVPELVFSVATAGLILRSLVAKDPGLMSYFGAITALVCKSVCDSRGARLVLGQPTVVPVSMGLWPPAWEEQDSGL